MPVLPSSYVFDAADTLIDKVVTEVSFAIPYLTEEERMSPKESEMVAEDTINVLNEFQIWNRTG